MTVLSRGRKRPFRRILIIKPSSLGDIVHALPVLAALRAAFPRAHIDWLVSTSFVPLLEGHPLLSEVIPFDRRRYGQMLRRPSVFLEFLRFLGFLRRRRFELVVDLQGLVRSGFIAWASGASTRVGFADAREFASLFYSRRVTCPRDCVHAVDRNLQLASAIGASPEKIEFPLGLRPEELQSARELLRKTAGEPVESFIAVLPGARWESKCWPPERHAQLIDELAGRGAPRCVLLGAEADRPLADAIASRTGAPVVDLVGKTTLRELAALLQLADLVVCQDSGPMHLAAALQRPIVALFGPTNPARTGPYCERARVVRRPLECSPCYGKLCPLGHQKCLRELPVSSVLEACAEFGAPALQPQIPASSAGDSQPRHTPADSTRAIP